MNEVATMREFHNLARTGKTRVWRIGVCGDQVITEHGEQGGKMQQVVDTAKAVNVGRSNEKCAEDVALDTMDREILLRTRQGYVPEGTSLDAGDRTSFDFSALPLNLRFYKPDNTPGSGMEKLIANGKVWFGRKRDGEMMVVTKDGAGRIRLYSRTMLVEHDKEPGVLWEERFPHLMAELAEIPMLPNSILLGELVMNRNGQDDFTHVSRVMKSLKDKSLRVQEEGGWLSYYVWDIAFWDGEDLLREETFQARYKLMTDVFKKAEYLLTVDIESSDFFNQQMVSTYEGSPTYDANRSHIWNAACNHAAKQKWEGHVVIDPTGLYGDKGWNLRGKTDRPGKVCAKLKPNYEDDFVAMWDPTNGVGEFGTGKYQGLIGSVQLYQYDSEGTLHPISQLGIGFTEADLKELSHVSLYPLTFKVEYKERTYISDGEKTNALRFATFVEVRRDKLPTECINPRL